MRNTTVFFVGDTVVFRAEAIRMSISSRCGGMHSNGAWPIRG